MYDLMKVLDNENAPKVGIFWYLPEENELFGVNSAEISGLKEVNGNITYPVLHKTFWQKQKHRAIAKGQKDSIFLKDYTQIPRGRIFYHDGKFTVMVGSWYKEHEDNLRELIKEEFDLDDFDFKIGECLELGNDWDEKEYVLSNF